MAGPTLELVEQRGDVVGAVGQAEAAAGADAAAVAPQVGGEHAVVLASGSNARNQFSPPLAIQPCSSTTVGAPGGPATSRTNVVPRPGSSTRRRAADRRTGDRLGFEAVGDRRGHQPPDRAAACSARRARARCPRRPATGWAPRSRSHHEAEVDVVEVAEHGDVDAGAVEQRAHRVHGRRPRRRRM